MLCFAMARPISRLTTMDANKFAPFLIVIISIGAYQSTQHWGDLLLLFGIGVFSWILRILDWPRIPFVIGFVLSAGAERYLFISMSRYGYDWMTRPMVLIIGRSAERRVGTEC